MSGSRAVIGGAGVRDVMKNPERAIRVASTHFEEGAIALIALPAVTERYSLVLG